MEIRTLLLEALNPDQNMRNQAEVKIDMLVTQNIGAFLTSCSKEFCNESNHNEIRRMASTLIINMISYIPKYKGLWEGLDRETKMKINNNVAISVTSSDKEGSKAACRIVATIAKSRCR